MGKDKLKRFREIDGFSHVLQPSFEDTYNRDFELKGKWADKFFCNDRPVILELGCGRGEYTIGLAKKYPDKNFIGIDIKGARIWKGARDALEENLPNVAFLRIRIESVKSFFGPDEIDEIWITFPDPQLKYRRAKKRLTGPWFLNSYKTFLKKSGIVHLKTDSRELYDYTSRIVKKNNLKIITATDNLYASGKTDDILEIKTHYEEIFLEEGKVITYLAFTLDGPGQITDVP